MDDSVKRNACHEQARQEVIQGLAGLAEAFENVRLVKTRVERKLEELFRAIEPRKQYRGWDLVSGRQLVGILDWNLGHGVYNIAVGAGKNPVPFY